MTITDQQLEDLLEQKPYSVEETERIVGPDKVYITPGAFEKIKTYARLVNRLAGSGCECYGFLLADKDGDQPLVRDAYLADNQDASAAHVSISGRDVITAGDEADRMGYKVIGWWHSHGSMSAFHSGTDDSNMETVLAQVAVNTLSSLYEERDVDAVVEKENGKTRIMIRDGGSRVYDIELDSSNVHILSKKATIGKPSSYAYSLVVNAHGQHYQEVAVKEFCNACKRKKEYPARQPELELVPVEKDVTFTLSQLEPEIRAKIDNLRAQVCVPSGYKRGRWDFDFDSYTSGIFVPVEEPEKVHTVYTPCLDVSTQELANRFGNRAIEYIQNVHGRSQKINTPNAVLSARYLDNLLFLIHKGQSFEDVVAALGRPRAELQWAPGSYQDKSRKREIKDRIAEIAEQDHAFRSFLEDYVSSSPEDFLKVILQHVLVPSEQKVQEKQAAAGSAAPEGDSALMDIIKKDITKREVEHRKIVDDFVDQFVEYSKNGLGHYTMWAKEVISDIYRLNRDLYSAINREELKGTEDYGFKISTNVSLFLTGEARYKSDMRRSIYKGLSSNTALQEDFMSEFCRAREKDKASVIERYYAYFTKDPDLLKLERFVDKFLSASYQYIAFEGEYASWMASYLLGMVEDKTTVVQKLRRDNRVSQKKIETLEDGRAKLTEYLVRKFAPREVKTKPTPAEIAETYALGFLKSFPTDPVAVKTYYERIDELRNNWRLSQDFAEAVTDYTMRGFPDREQGVKAKYSAWMGGVLERIIQGELITFEGAVNAAGKPVEDATWNDDYFYLEKDRKAIAHQLCFDLSSFLDREESLEQKERLKEFMNKFTKAYLDEPQDIDGLIEECLPFFVREEEKDEKEDKEEVAVQEGAKTEEQYVPVSQRKKADLSVDEITAVLQAEQGGKGNVGMAAKTGEHNQDPQGCSIETGHIPYHLQVQQIHGKQAIQGEIEPGDLIVDTSGDYCIVAQVDGVSLLGFWYHAISGNRLWENQVIMAKDRCFLLEKGFMKEGASPVNSVIDPGDIERGED